jgi:ribonuclease E
MPNKMLIDATHPEETRVVVVRGNRVEEFDFESAQRKQLRGNIYLAKVTRVEPSLQAAFVEYGGNRHGFLAFSEIHPDYYQIPVADRQALIEDDERAHREAEEEADERSNRRRSRHRNSRRRGNSDRVRSAPVDDARQDQNQDQPYPDGARDASSPAGEIHRAGEHAAEDTGESTHRDESFEHSFEADDAESLATRREQADHDATDGAAQSRAAFDDADPPEVTAAVEAAGPAANETDVGHVVGHLATEAASIAENHDDPLVEEASEPGGDDHPALGEVSAEHQGDNRAVVEEDDEHDEAVEEEIVESVGGDDAMEEVPERHYRPRRQYKIQEVIKRRQVMLIQVVKEERGNKGAALTTYLSLAGRYAVLMPNTARGGGISRKITSAQDRSRLKDVVQDLDVPEGMGIILRTAGASRTKPEIERDFEYLLRLWETVRDLTLKSTAPTLVYEEGSLIKRSIRDLYNKDIDEVIVAGEAGCEEARDFMKMLMPGQVRAVKRYQGGQPLFSRMGVESQLDAMFSPTMQLRSGGYIVINQTEALVSIDVNSGRSTREHHIEDTALKTNLEAAEEIARQLRLRDLAGLIVIDFIDMDEKRNNRSVERRLSECLRHDRARIQVGRISHFGLLEMSRQRIRASVLESSTEPCPQCGGTGHVRSVASVALQLLRSLEETLMKGATHNLTIRTRTEVALYVLNHKRGHLRDLENTFKVSLTIVADANIAGPQAFAIDRGDQVHTLEAAKALLAAQAATPLAPEEPLDTEDLGDGEAVGADDVLADEGIGAQATDEAGETQDGDRHRRRRRRGRRGRGEGRERFAQPEGAPEDANGNVVADDEAPEDDGAEAGEVAEGADGYGSPQPDGDSEPRRRRRGRRGGRRRRRDGSDGLAASVADDVEGTIVASEAEIAVADLDRPPQPTEFAREPAEASFEHVAEQRSERAEAAPIEAARPVVDSGPTAGEPETVAERARRRSTVREKVSFGGDEVPPAAPAEPTRVAGVETSHADAEPAASAGDNGEAAPRRAGWWSRRFSGG